MTAYRPQRAEEAGDAMLALAAFVIFYLTMGLRSTPQASSLIIGGVALVILIGAGVAGRRVTLRTDTSRPARLSAYGIGCLVLILSASWPFIGVALPFIALGTEP